MGLEVWPARLIEVNHFGPPFDGPRATFLDVRLFKVEGTCPPFVALSYCWGRNSALHQRYITTSESINARKSRIPFDTLPNTIRDAILITRCLGYDYVWIDAICIIQDSREDWKMEAAKMGALYSKAIVTIAADLGADSDTGCFNDRSTPQDLKYMDPVWIPGTLHDGKTSSIFIQQWPHTWSLPHSPLYESIKKGSTGERAWILQERLLSPRILHYTEEQLVWECRRTCLAEDNLPIAFDDRRTAPGLMNMFKLDIKETEHINRLLDTWYSEIVTNYYARRKLTNPGDKLIAVSGLARTLHYRLQTPYIAGLWYNQLLYFLPWRRRGAVNPSKVYRSPSFLWAAHDTEVIWPLGKSVVEHSTILDWNIELNSQDTFGSVSGGWLRVRGRMGTATLCSNEDFGAAPGDDISPETVLQDSHGQHIASAFMDESPTTGRVHFLILSEREKSGQTHILLLQPAEGTDEFKRVGSASRSTVELWATEFPFRTITIL
jgi:hypothetical protein